MPDEEQTEETTVSTIDTVIVVPTTEEPQGPPDYGAQIVALEMRVAALETARVEDSDNDGTDDGTDDTGSNDAGAGDETETGKTTEEPERDKPITRHWLFGRLW